MKKKQYKTLKKFWKQRQLFLLLLPGILYYAIFKYGPMYGIVVAMQNYSPFLGVGKSPWVGLYHFKRLFTTDTFGRLFFNTLKMGILNFMCTYPAGVLFAVLLNEVRRPRLKKVYQTVSYLPVFLSMVIVCSMFKDLFALDGVINQTIKYFGGEAIYFSGSPKYYPLVYLSSAVWSVTGSGAIIYLAAIAGIDQNLYEAASIDGCSRLKQIWYITLPSILPTMVTMFLLNVGNTVRVSPDRTLLLYNEMTLETADIIGSYVYRVGLMGKSYSFATAVGIFESVIASVVLIVTNKLSKKMTGQGLW